MVDSIPSATLQEEVPRTNNGNQRTSTTNRGVNKYKVCTIIFFISTICLIIFIARQPSSTSHFCKDGWIGLKNNCYYFSKEERDWNSSRYNCTTQQADLTVIDTTEVMEFLRDHKCTSDHWIGLQMTEDRKEKWVDESIFNNLFNVRGNEKCAYLSDDGVATARCYTERKWICRIQKNTS